MDADFVVQLLMEFGSLSELEEEASMSLYQGRALVVGSSAPAVGQICELVLVHPLTGQRLILSAEVVFGSSGDEQVGLEMVDFGDQTRATLRDFVSGSEFLDETDADTTDASRPESPWLDEPMQLERVSAVADEPPNEEETVPLDLVPSDPPPSSTSGSGRVSSSRRGVLSIFERLRGLNAGQREKVARSGTLQERKTLERIYGPAVWESLLNNQSITGPEVARIAKNGTASRPIITTIASNSAWIAKPEVRRALLSNPRLGGSSIERVLRALPPAELKQVPRQTAYPAKVRAVAERLLYRR